MTDRLFHYDDFERLHRPRLYRLQHVYRLRHNERKRRRLRVMRSLCVVALFAVFALLALIVRGHATDVDARMVELELQLPRFESGIMAMATDALAVEQPEPWELWLTDTLGISDYVILLAAAISGNAAIMSLPVDQRADFAALNCAVLYKESHMRHFTDGGGVKRGDGGRAIGIGQIHRSPWQRYYSDELGREIDLDLLADNVEVSAWLLIRSGWNELPVEQVASYYNTGKRGSSNDYGTLVAELYEEIRNAE